MSIEVMSLLIFYFHRKQTKFATSLFAAFQYGDVKSLVDGQQKIPVEDKFDAFDVSVRRILLTGFKLR